MPPAEPGPGTSTRVIAWCVKICMIANIPPESADEVFVLAASLKGKKNNVTETLKVAFSDLAKLKQSASSSNSRKREISPKQHSLPSGKMSLVNEISKRLVPLCSPKLSLNCHIGRSTSNVGNRILEFSVHWEAHPPVLTILRV
ncbi:hypothetical protein RHMOL_Rhmol02G0098500 [Rhododendron molle]|uniref:Uncharacterized protein n=1 Tax=Rhododendron molle TaxID=49168 RepID=A0ACC0PN63_RHOML|nr:hypothetical protein RHMOL_Rhmol02G0098500 [Rhododendron molle]